MEKRRSELSEMKRTRFVGKRPRIFEGCEGENPAAGRKARHDETKGEGGEALPLFFLLPYVYLHRELPEKHKGLGKLDTFFSRSGGTKGRATDRLRRSVPNLFELDFPSCRNFDESSREVITIIHPVDIFFLRGEMKIMVDKMFNISYDYNKCNFLTTVSEFN